MVTFNDGTEAPQFTRKNLLIRCPACVDGKHDECEKHFCNCSHGGA